MKKVLSLFLSIVLVLGIFMSVPFTESPFKITAEAASSGTCGKNLTWTLNNSGVLTISGTGDMTNYSSSSSAPWYSSSSSIKGVVINEGVTSIGDSAFYYCSSLTPITIPDSVTSIGDDAFYYCTSLTSITIPDSVTSIGSYAFYNCTSLTSITIGNSVTSIGGSAFGHCDSLKSVTIGNGVTSIGSKAFYNCKSLTTITIPDSITSIGESAFSDCGSLTSINVSTNNPYYTSVDGVLFNKAKTELIQYPAGKTSTSYTIPNSVTNIGDYAFEGCSRLTSITIPDSVTSIGNGAFCSCSRLTSITIPDSVTSIGYRAFYDCTSLESITIPDSVTSIGDYAFYWCDSLTDVYYSGSSEDWSNISIGSYNDPLLDATIHFNSVSCSHTSTKWVADKAATCTVAGSKHKECTVCGETLETETISALGHDYSTEWTVDKEATYDKEGSKSHHCSRCGSKSDVTVIPAVGNNYTDVFHSEVFALWWTVAFSGSDQVTEFSPYSVKFYTLRKINLDDYYAGEKEIDYGYGTYYVRSYSIPADVFEGEVLKHFNISDMDAFRNDTGEPTYNADTNTYDMLELGGWGDSITYATKGYRNLGNGIYEVYGYTVEMAYEKPDDAVEGVDYIMNNGYPAEIVKCLRVTIEYNGTDVKFLSWETISLDEVPDIQNLVHNHISSDWITDKKATVNAAGSKHKKCTKCGKVLETATIPQLKPSDPTLSKAANANGGVTVTWKAVSGADSYRVYRKTSSTSWTCLNKKVTGTSYTDTTAKSGTTYYYTVKAENEAGVSGYNKTGISVKYLAMPTVTIANASTGVKVSWNKITGASKYYVYRKASGEKSWTRLTDSATGTSYTDTKAKSGTTYYYTVKAVSGSVASAFKSSSALKYLAQPKVSSLSNTNSGITVKWGKITGAKGYTVYRKASGDKSWTNLGNTTGTSFTDTKAKAGTTYYYTVRAYNGSVKSTYTSSTAIRRLTTPTLKSVTSAKSGITFKWNKVTGAEGYYVYRKTGSGDWKKIATVKGGSTVSYLDKTAKKGTTYTYTVRAYYSSSSVSYFNTTGLKIKDKY